jgi:predicted nucleic acid-binding protein
VPGEDPLLLDACVTLNLQVADLLPEVAATEPRGLAMLSAAAAEVAGLDTAHVHVFELSAAELDLFVELAANIDDGEAATLAAAKIRGWRLATDDRKARRVANEVGLARPATTSMLVESWSRTTAATPDRMRDVLSRIEQQARFRPPPDDAHYSWWRSTMDQQA